MRLTASPLAIEKREAKKSRAERNLNAIHNNLHQHRTENENDRTGGNPR